MCRIFVTFFIGSPNSRQLTTPKPPRVDSVVVVGDRHRDTPQRPNVFACAIRLLGGGNLGGLRRLGVLQDLDDLLLLDQEGAHDALADALMAQHTAVRATHGLLTLGDAGALGRAGRPDAVQLLLALAALRHVATLLHVLVDQTAAGRANTEREELDCALIIITLANVHRYFGAFRVWLRGSEADNEIVNRLDLLKNLFHLVRRFQAIFRHIVLV